MFLTALFAHVLALQGTAPAPIPIGNLSQSMHDQLAAARREIFNWSLLVDGVAAQDECDTPTRMSCDTTFWNGIMCSNPHAGADTQFACAALNRSQSPNGQLWRSPWESAAQNSSNPNLFSRDQGLATLAALTRIGGPGNATKTAGAADAFYDPWLEYIESHDGLMCPRNGSGGFASDCQLVTPFWCTFDKVASRKGLARPPADLMVPRLGAGACNNDHGFVYVSTVVNEAGSALHLAAIDVLIRRLVNDWDAVMQKAADKLHSREPKNPFFWWLARGASDDLGREILLQIPTNSGNGTGAAHPRRQWSFCRTDSEEAYKESMGWEFVMLIDHLLAVPTI